MEEKEGNEVKKVCMKMWSSCTIGIGILKSSTPIGNWADFFILQSLTKRIKIARQFIGELFCYAFFFSSFVFLVAK